MAAETAVSKDNLHIPLIDFSKFTSTDAFAKSLTAQEILKGFTTSGFIYLRNHPIPADIVDAVFAQSAQFFKRSKEEKQELAWTTARANRGYSAPGQEKVTQITDKEDVEKLRAEVPDLKESFEIGREGEEGCPNQWPDEKLRSDDESKEFKAVTQDFFARCKDLHVLVMRALALGLGLEEHYFDEYCDGGDNTLRLLHYPEVRKDVFKANANQVRAGVHSDYGSITLLFQDNRGGLQVQSPEGTFVDATPIPGTIVVNAADLLMRWSNDLIKSTKHRVVEPPAPQEGEVHPARYSVAYFCNPNFEKVIDVIPGTWGNGKGQKKYEGIESGKYLEQRLEATY
ncbi:MAG: hypothetical protein M1820_003254 [Bogoriella megaspora]|nr:MAG: hypothetical protein M1820_003254 [Bogoriella megaspora]